MAHPSAFLRVVGGGGLRAAAAGVVTDVLPSAKANTRWGQGGAVKRVSWV